MMGLMWIEEEGWIEGEKGIMDIERGFLLLEMLRLRMYSLESSKSRCLGVSVCISPLLPTPFIGLRKLNFHATISC